jgi:hypothetical protein
MKSFNRFLGFSALILVILMITSFMIAFSYTVSHPDLFDSFHISFSDSFNWNINNHKSSDYETIVEAKNFTTDNVISTISINSDFTEIIFIEEDRSDILVEQYLEKPNTSAYRTSYDVSVDDDELKIISSQSIFNIMLDRDYENKITIHVPNNVHFTTLDIKSALKEITKESILSNVDNIYIDDNIGRVTIDITSPKEVVKVTSDIGSITITGSSNISTLDLTSNLDSIYLDFDGNIDYLYMESDLGSINAIITGAIQAGNIVTDIGKVVLRFGSDIGSLDVTTSVGNIDLYMRENFSTYAQSDTGSENIITIESDTGSISINAIE